MLKEVSGTVVNSSSPTNFYLDSVIYACDNADVKGEFDTSIRMKDKWNTGALSCLAQTVIFASSNLASMMWYRKKLQILKLH